MIRLEADFTPEGRLDLALISARAGEERAAELNLDEHLRVERREGRVKGRARDRLVDVVGRCDRVPDDGCGLILARCHTGDEIGAYEARSATTSAGLKPASAKRSRMEVMVSNGSGTSRSGAGAVASGRPSMNSRRGAPAQFEKPTAPANWILKERG